jgi:hypothetical protein
MSAAPAPEAVRRLANIAERMASSHDGERANAASLFSQEVRKLGRTLTSVVEAAFAPQPPAPPLPVRPPRRTSDPTALLRWLLDEQADRLSLSTQAFLRSIRWQGYAITRRQAEVIERIAVEIRAEVYGEEVGQ